MTWKVYYFDYLLREFDNAKSASDFIFNNHYKIYDAVNCGEFIKIEVY